MTTNYKEYLSDGQFRILKELIKSLGGNKFSLKMSSGVEDGSNFAGVIVDVKVVWDKMESEHTSYFTIKVIPSNELLLSLFAMKASYEREIYFYSEVFPNFIALQFERGVKTIFKPYPHFYKMLSATQEMLVFENLREVGYIHKNRKNPLDYNHMLIIIKNYAKLHALSLALRDQKPKLFEKFIKNAREQFFENFDKGAIPAVSKHRIENALRSLDPVLHKEVYDKFSYYATNVLEVMRKAMNEVNQYSVLCHIDTGIPNYLFKYKGQSDIPTDVSILDWQLSRLGSPAIDLTTLIFSASDKTLRKRYDDLILEYHRTLSFFLEELGSNAEKLLPFQVLQKELKTCSISGLFMAIHLIYVYTTKSEDVPNIFNGESFVYDLTDRFEFDARVKDAIIDYDTYGYNFW